MHRQRPNGEWYSVSREESLEKHFKRMGQGQQRQLGEEDSLLRSLS